MIVIIGSKEETHSLYMYAKIRSMGHRVCLLDSRKYPKNISIDWSPTENKAKFKIGDDSFSGDDIEGIYWRWYYGIPYEKVSNSDDAVNSIIYRERTCLMSSVLCSLESKSYNSIQAVELHQKKAYQSFLLAQNNIRIPKTMITNSPEEFIDFCKKFNKNVIYKPVRGGAYTKKVSGEDFTLEKLQRLEKAPIQLQAFIQGVDIRVFAFETGEIFPAKIAAKSVDFREDTSAKIEPVILPDKVCEDCIKILKLFGLKYSGIDIRLTPEGEYVFIEANPAPMFIHFENVTGFPISDTLISKLKA